MKVLLVNTLYDPYIMGGAEISTQLLAQQLKKMGVEVVVLTLNPKSFRTVVEHVNGIKVYRINPLNPYTIMDKRNFRLSRIIKLVLNCWNIITYILAKRIIQNEKPDVVHTNTLYDLSPSIWTAAKAAGVPVVHTVRDYDLLCMRSNIFTSYACKLYKWVKNRPFKHVGEVTFISKFIRNVHEQHGMLNGKQSVVIYNSVELDQSKINDVFQYRSSKKKSPLKFVYFGRMEEAKGIFLLLESFKELLDNGQNNNMELHVLASADSTLRTKYAHPQIKFHGFLRGADKDRVLMDCDIAVVPSIWDEPFGRVIIEAYKYGLPVLGSSAGAIPELIDHKMTGYIFDKNDKRRLTQILLEIARKPEILSGCEQYINNKVAGFSAERSSRQFEDVYRDAMN